MDLRFERNWKVLEPENPRVLKTYSEFGNGQLAEWALGGDKRL